jgi:hypothetical protein
MSTSNDTDSAEEEEEYTTSYTKLLQQRAKLAHLSYNNNDMHSRSSNYSLNDYIFTSGGQNDSYNNYRNIQKRGMQQQGRKELGVRLIQQRWRGSGYHDVTNDFAEQDDDTKGGLSNGEEYGAISSSSRVRHDDGQQKRSKRRRANSLSFSDEDDTSLSSPNNYYSNITSYTSNTLNNNNKTAPQQPPTSSIQPSLLFRRTNSTLYYSNERLYTNIQFLTETTSNVVIGVDNYGDLDVVCVPSSSFNDGGSVSGGGASEQEDGENNDGGECGIGTLQADRLPLFNNIHNHANDGPRHPMDKNFHCEVFGYENGSKFVVGLGSGQVQLFTTEHAHAATAGNCRNEQGGENSPTLGSTTNLWSCLPSTSTVTTGPQRRYHRNDEYSLVTMLTSNNNNTTQTTSSVFDAYNTSFLEEISNWDNNTDQTSNQHHVLLQGNNNKRRCPWAFREGGSLSSTALIGVCVDAEGDCFSLRVIDERLLQQTKNGSDSSCAAMMKVVVVDDRNAATSMNCRERVESVCFTGEYGLVTSHSIAQNNDEIGSKLTATCLKVSLIWLVYQICVR